ncbi:MAG: hypothetical protein NZ900_02685 [Synergistetes bacterium]|nr:hypothetical protein [Synergistota bacterium]MDW8191835.1 hypothetical protein [Synergistota bacterium]
MKNIKLLLLAIFVVLSVGGVALAYFWRVPCEGSGVGPGFDRGYWGPSPYMGGYPAPWEMGSPYSVPCHVWGPKAWFRGYGIGPHRAFGEYAPYFKEKVEALSKVSGIPVEKLQSVLEKYPMLPRLLLKAVAVSLILNKDLEEVVKDLRDNPPLYLWKSGVDPSVLLKKEWEIKGKLFQELQKFRKP